MTKNNNTADERLWILKECAKMKSVKVEAPPDAKSPEQMLREIKQEIERRKKKESIIYSDCCCGREKSL